MNKTQNGFAIIESLLILIIIAIIGGTGYYVWHSKSQTDKTLDNASNSNSVVSPAKSTNSVKTSSPATPQTKYLTIVQWGVRIPYTGEDTYSYTYQDDTPNTVEVVSANLSSKYGCTSIGGGLISRFLPNDQVDPAGDTAKDLAKSNPGSFYLVGNYYYGHTHDQASCSDSVPPNAQNQTNSSVDAIMSKIEPAS